MEALIQLVAAAFARHGIECRAGDSKPGESRASAPVWAATSGLGSPLEPTALPEHNFGKKQQLICP